jgi:hypothetical protein
MWFTKGQPVRFPLLTTSAPSDAGLLGAASTTVLVGDRPLGYNGINGLRIGTGFFGDEDRRFGFQMYGFLLERASNVQTFGTLDAQAGTSNSPITTGSILASGLVRESGIPVLARPYIDSATGVQSTVVLSGPGFGAAQVQVGTNTQTWGVSPEGVWNFFRTQPGSRLAWSLDFTAGYRYIFEKEQLWVYSATEVNGLTALPQFEAGPFGTTIPLQPTLSLASTTVGGVNVTVPGTISIRDTYTAVNQFNGFVVGFNSDARYGMFTANLFGKIAVGDMHERVDISGVSSFYDPSARSGLTPAAAAAFPGISGGGLGSAYGGVLANAANIGTHIQDRFSYIPEVGGKVGIALTRGLTAYIGGNFLYFPNLVRPGNLVNPVVSSAAIPFSVNYGATGAPRGPGFQMIQTDHWLGGVSCGLILKY